MKRFLAFAGYQYYPDAGMLNFVGDFDNHNEALEKSFDDCKRNQ